MNDPSVLLGTVKVSKPRGRASTSDKRARNACTECKRRKVKCDGQEPCYFCKWYRHPNRCFYSSPTPRSTLTRKAHEDLETRLQNAKSILGRLFPRHTCEQLLRLSRQELLALTQEVQPENSLEPSSHGEGVQVDMNVSPRMDSSVTATAYPTPSVYEYNESVDNLEDREAVADDVNSLDPSSTRTSSYVGSSSAAAGVRMLFHLAPDAVLHQDKARSKRQGGNATLSAKESSKNWDTQTLVNAYFEHIHPTTPILDEEAFKAHLAAGKRNDSPWLALSHMVLALGTVAHTTSESNDDIKFYRIAKSHLGLESLGSGHVETLQALILMGGWYLQYRNRPNTASAIMGAAVRMAYAMGLHRDNVTHSTPGELGRRIWGSLIVLDAGEGLTLGRVSSVDVFKESRSNLMGSQPFSDNGYQVPSTCSILTAHIAFSRQACEIHKRLIESAELTFEETLAFDAHLYDWYDTLPAFLRSAEPCPPWLRQPRRTLRWKFDNLRLMMNRPILLSAILNGTQFEALDQNRKVCVRRCQSLAKQVIDDIAHSWAHEQIRNQYFGWPACWYLFQATLIPLLSLFGFRDDPRQADWHEQVIKAETLLEGLESWSVAGRQTLMLIASLHVAQRRSSKNYQEKACFAATTASLEPSQELTPRCESHTQQNTFAAEQVSWMSFLDSPNALFPLSGPFELDFGDFGSGMSTWDIPLELEEWQQG